MPRPERPVEGSGPVPDLARELRSIRDRAGTPGYRGMQDTARFSRETLSAAARGAECPTWEVISATGSDSVGSQEDALSSWHRVAPVSGAGGSAIGTSGLDGVHGAVEAEPKPRRG